MITEKQFLDFYEKHPELSGAGFKYPGSKEHEVYREHLKKAFNQVLLCFEYFNSNDFKNRKYKRRLMSSYWLKHVVEH